MIKEIIIRLNEKEYYWLKHALDLAFISIHDDPDYGSPQELAHTEESIDKLIRKIKRIE